MRAFPWVVAIGLIAVSNPLWATQGPQVTHDFELVQPAPPISGSAVQIADWPFDAGCNPSGWSAIDGRIRNDGSNYWHIDNAYSGTGSIVNNAAVLSKHDLCWANPDGYGDDWDYSIVLKYRGAGSTLSFDYLCDTEPGIDFVTVEADSAGASESLVDYGLDPFDTPSRHRVVLLTTDGLQTSSVTALALPDFGVPASTHEVYIRFQSNATGSSEDGGCAPSIAAALVVDNVVVTGGLAYSEDFEGALNANVTLVNTAPSTPFGSWARLYPGITDNDVCTDNTTCAWLFTDDTSPTNACNGYQGYAPGGLVIRDGIDNRLVSPWVSLASTPSASRTQLEYRIFPGNVFSQSRIVLNVAVRSKVRVDNTDTSAPGDSIDCVGPWQHASDWRSLGAMTWLTAIADLTASIDPRAEEIQIRFSVADWRLLTETTPGSGCGPGPFLDDVRLWRGVLTGPVIDPGVDWRSQAQDAFPADLNPITPGEHFTPNAGIFGTCPFSCAMDIGSPGSPNLITGDSITVRVVDARGANGIAWVKLYGAIIAGPHTGKTPPLTAAVTDFFEITAQQSLDCQGNPIPGAYFVDLDDTYFRGGDQMVYVWGAMDNNGGVASYPPGLPSLPPTTVAAAEAATGGLLEVDFLPTIDWDPGYLAAIVPHPTGDIDPTPSQIANSSQTNRILYVQKTDPYRRSNPYPRTTFMYALDANAISTGRYDVYDVQGFGNTNNDLGSRANVVQAAGYELIVDDMGRRRSDTVPDGSNGDSQKIDQQSWYLDYVQQAATSPSLKAGLWLIGENTVEEIDGSPLLTTAATGLAATSVPSGVDAQGVANYSFCSGPYNFAVDAAMPLITLCSLNPHADFDELNAAGGATITHEYKIGATSFGGAVVMKTGSSGPGCWTTVVSTFPWSTITAFPPKPGAGALPRTSSYGDALLDAVLQGTVTPPAPAGCACPRAWSSTNPVPSARSQAAMAYDSDHGEVILYGGWDGAQTLGDTWKWDGSQWTQLAPGTSPGPRRGQGMTYDSGRHVVVLYGGYDGASYRDDTWEWNGTSWTQSPAPGAVALAWTGMAYDPVEHVVVRYGGSDSNGRSNYTWEYDGTSWTVALTNSPPSYRSTHVMAYDPDLGKIVMFGGEWPGNTKKNDTWTYAASTNTWTQLAVTGPSARKYATLSTDWGCGSLVLFGGQTNGGESNEVWRFDQGTWTQETPASSPAGRHLHAAAVDAQGRLVLAGGDDGVAVLGDGWRYGCTSQLTDGGMPETAALGIFRNAPNPFRGTTRVHYGLPRAGTARVAVYDVGGRLVRVLRGAGVQAAGHYDLGWDGRDEAGRPAGSGVYFCRLDLDGRSTSHRMVLLR